MNEAEDIVTKVSRDLAKLVQLVTGNGTKKGSIVGRLDELEKRFENIMSKLEEISNRPCREPCLWEEHVKEEKQLKEKRRSWRIGDIANYIQILMLLLIAYGLFK